MSQPFQLDARAQTFLDAAERVAVDVVRGNAARTDAEARFPRENIDALRDAGLLRLVGAEAVGGAGQSLRTAAAVAERIARECASTAMILIMHNCAAAVAEAFGTQEQRRSLAGGKLGTLAFSEAGSRSHFWLPVSTAEHQGDHYVLNARKQLITAAGEADVYVWSSKPAAGDGFSSIFWVPSDAAGLQIPQRYTGLGLRGNSSAPIIAEQVRVPQSALLGADGLGFEIMLGSVLPWVCLQNHAVSVGLMEGALARTVAHVSGQSYEYSGAAIADFPQVRGYVARMRTKLDMCKALLIDALGAVETGREDAQLRVLQAKVAGAETSIEVHDLAMRSTGGAAYRKDLALERYFRDSRAASIMAPVSDALWDFIGKAVCGMPLFG